jgi:hypothetical protein
MSQDFRREIVKLPDKGKPAERRGRKASGLPASRPVPLASMTAELPSGNRLSGSRLRASPKER